MCLSTCSKFKTYHTRNSHVIAARLTASVNGKKVEIAVKQIICGIVGVQVSGTVGNPESLEEYHQFVEVEKVHSERNRGARL